MTTNTITQLTDPQGYWPDPLTDLLRSGALRLIEQAVEAELSVLLEAYASEKTDDGRALLIAPPPVVQPRPVNTNTIK